MDETLMNKIMTVGTIVLALACGVGCVGLLIAMAVDFTWTLLLCVGLTAVGTFCSAMGAVYFGEQIGKGKSIFTNEAEREVLNSKQRRTLRKARGEVVMERAMIEIQHEQENIVHRQLESAHDESVPPHRTQWTPGKDERTPLPPRSRSEYGH